VQSVETLV